MCKWWPLHLISRFNLAVLSHHGPYSLKFRCVASWLAPNGGSIGHSYSSCPCTHWFLGGKKCNTPQVASSSFLSCLALTLAEFSLKLVVFGSLRLLRSSSMSSSLVLLCNSRSFVIDLSYSYLYSHNLYPAVSDIYFMIVCNVIICFAWLGN